MRFIKSLSLMFLVSLLGMSVTSAGAASFDCAKAATETEIAIRDDEELSQLDELLAMAWENGRKYLTSQQQKDWLIERDSCTDKECLRNKIGLRIGTILAISSGLESRINETPFRYVNLKRAYVRCRKNYQGTESVKFVEILFSHEEGGPSFQEINIYSDGRFSASIWDWLSWSAVASMNEIVIEEGDQRISKRSFSVSKEFVNGLAVGRTWSWIIHEVAQNGASFTSFYFETDRVKECLNYFK